MQKRVNKAAVKEILGKFQLTTKLTVKRLAVALDDKKYGS